MSFINHTLFVFLTKPRFAKVYQKENHVLFVHVIHELTSGWTQMFDDFRLKTIFFKKT